MKNYQQREFSRTSVRPKDDVQAITLEARLYEDLDFDSIDAVDMIVKLKEMTGKTVKPEDFKTARTISDVVEAVYKMLM